MSADTSEAIHALAESVSKIAHGDKFGPGGLEALAMMNKDGHKLNAEALSGVASSIETAGDTINDGLESVASAIQELATAISEQSK
jgi:methyl-accepting chemotaxis protein